MRVAKYISDLLYEYECVVIPGLGGFISNEVPASIHDNNHSFNPPSKKIVFNPHLQINDGLLINHIAKHEDISYSDARIRLEQFVLKCKYALGKGKRINFYKIGHLFDNAEDKIEFDPDKSRNYYADSFGMSSFISPPVKRDSNIRLEKKHADRKPKQEKQTAETTRKREKQPRYISLNLYSILFILLIGLAFVLGYNSIKDFYYKNAAGIPFFYSTPNEYLITHFHKLTFFKEKPDAAAKTNNQTDQKNENKILTDEHSTLEKEEMPVKQEYNDQSIDNVLKMVAPEIKLPEKQSRMTDQPAHEEMEKPVSNNPQLEENRFFIIAGSFQDESNAHKLLRKLRTNGYQADIIGQNKYGMYRVSFAGFTTEAMAEEQLAIIRKEENPDAWVFAR